jgi:hypothetical protein
MLRCTVHICVSLVPPARHYCDAGLFDPAFRGTEDIDMWLRIAKRGGRIAVSKAGPGELPPPGGQPLGRLRLT